MTFFSNVSEVICKACAASFAAAASAAHAPGPSAIASPTADCYPRNRRLAAWQVLDAAVKRRREAKAAFVAAHQRLQELIAQRTMLERLEREVGEEDRKDGLLSSDSLPLPPPVR
jgi:hypothetical protein